MGSFFDNVNITDQTPSSAAGQLDALNSLTGGGAGGRGLTQNFVFGRGNNQEAPASATQATVPAWAWLAAGVVALAWVLKGKGKA